MLIALSNSKKIRRSRIIAANILVLFFLMENVFGFTRSSPYLEPSTTVTSPPAFLQNGTTGSRVIYANNTSAKVSTVAPRNWLSGWEKRVKITISKSNISGALSGFPVLVHLSSSSGIYGDDVRFVFNDLLNDANRRKIAITASDGTTQCYAEIEKWDTANKQAWLWTRVPSLSNTADTILYLYYDRNQADNTNYVGDTGSTAARNAWDSNFKGVWHLSETIGGIGAIKDSTSNNNVGTTYGNPTLNAAGRINGAISFDGVDDFINMSNSQSLQFTSSLTIEGWINPYSFGAGSDVDIILRKGEGNPNDYQLAIHDQKLELMIEENDGAGLDSSASLLATTWYYMAGTWNGSTRKVYLNGFEDGSGSKTGSIIPDTRAIYIGGRSGTDLSNGILDEVRASNTTRSASWVKASYESERDNLLDFGSEELRSYYPTNYNILSGNWYDPSWGYRKRIMVNHAQVQVNLTAFPVLINLTSNSGLANHAQSNGNDILFTSSNGVTKLSHEIEKYTNVTGALVAWVKVSSLSSSVDTDLYMYYGNPTCGSQQDATNVWDSNFIAVWHLKESPTDSAPQFKDSKDGNHGTANNMVGGDQQACKIDGGLNFNGANAKIPTNTSTSVKGLTQYTVSAWVNTGVLDSLKHVIYEESIGTSALSRVKLLITTTNRFSLDGRDLDTGSYTTWVSPTTALSTNTWYYMAGVFDSVSDAHHFMINGVDTANTVTASTIASATPFDTPTIGARPSASEFWSGKIDELRISNIARPTAWLTTEYNNQNSPSTFYSVSTREEQNPRVSGTVPASLQTVDSDYFVVRSTESATSTTAYNPSGYNLIGNTALVSGTTNDLASNNGVYMTFRSYASATSAQTLYTHQETTTIGGTSYYLLGFSSADATGTTLSASAGTTGRKLMGKFVHQLTGVSSVPASTWTSYYRAYIDSSAVAAHGDVDILIRMSNGTVRSTTATNVANSSAITTSWSTVSGTYSWTAYTVVDQNDYLEIDCYLDVTTSSSGASVYLRIDDNSVALSSQTRAGNIYLPSEYTSEVEFTGSSNTETWTQLVWSLDSAWTTGSVTVIIQLYNYTLSGYPTSGNGYSSYTSNTTANTDEARTQTIIANPTHFRDGSGNWKTKVKGVKTTTTQFDFKADWIEYKPSYNSQYTVSAEFQFTSMTKNVPTQLNFTIVSEYDIASVSVSIQVWNYSSSAYVISGEGYLTYTSSGSNETKLLSIITNPQLYTSNGNAKIKVSGVKTTTTQYQQKTNQVKLQYKYGFSSNYNYVLKIVNQVSDTWKIRLRAYSQSNIGRLNNCTIYFRNSSDGTSRQIYIQNGAYVTQTGPWYDLPASPAERYIAVTLDANDSQVSYVYVYLEILVPNKTTYSQYTITFEIT